MKPHRALPLRPILVCLLLGAAILGGCSKSTKPKVVPPPVMPQTDADDIAQLIATSIAADQGGWYFAVTAMAETVTSPLPTVAQRPAGPPGFAAGPGAIRPFNNFTITRAGLSYDFSVTYFHSDLTAWPTRDSAASNLEALVNANNGSFNANGVQATYGYHSDTDYTIFDIHASHDTLDFSNIVDDSSFALVKSAFKPDTIPGRLWYHLNYFDYELKIPRAKVPASPWPASGEVNWIIEVYGMGSYDRNDKKLDYLTEARMTFDGTENGTFTIYDSLDGTYNYRYKMNIKTGALTRL